MEMKHAGNSRKDKLTGIWAAAVSALIFGLTPAIAKMAYAGGSNGVTMTFTRSLFALPVLYLITRSKGISLRLSRKELPATLALCLFGAFFTTLTLYSSYMYINVGMATVLHYIFPVLVTLGSILFFREKVVWWKLVALAVGFCGVLTFFRVSAQDAVWGVALAAGSGLFYAALLLGMDYAVVRSFHYFKMSFYCSLVSCGAAAAWGLAAGVLNLGLTPQAWLYSLVVSMLVSVVGFSSLKLAIAKCGASTTAIVSMLEPISGIFFGWLLLGEQMTLANVAGCALILLSLVMVTFYSARDAQKDSKPMETPGSPESG